MDIGDFYDADPRRRASAEVELGRDWHDATGARYELCWVQDTGELYVMREVASAAWTDPFGDFYVDDIPDSGLVVTVEGVIPTHERLEEIFQGWADAMAGPDGIAWVVRRLEDAGIRTAVDPGRPSPDAPAAAPSDEASPVAPPGAGPTGDG